VRLAVAGGAPGPAALDQVVAAGLLRLRHALIRDEACASLLKTRRAALHARVAAALGALAPGENIGTKLGVYAEAFPAFGVCEPPVFDRKHL
jgi:hypothetical protein